MAMFVLLSAEFTIFLFVIILRDCNADLPTCRQLSECACALNDGREINISRLGVPGFPKFNYQNSGDYYYTYNPCYNFKDNYCRTECIACQHNDAGTTSFPLGTAGSAEWSQDGGYYSIHYKDGADGRSTVVELECDASAQEPRLNVIGESGSSKLYYFRMTTECACPGRCGQTAPLPSPQRGGLSAGGVMCIIFSVLVVVYFIGGVLFMKFVRGAGGMELVPNSGFWKELPGFIKDGVMFVISCGKRASYKSMS